MLRFPSPWTNFYTDLDSGERNSILLQLDWCSCVILFSWIYTVYVLHDLVLYVISIMRSYLLWIKTQQPCAKLIHRGEAKISIHHERRIYSKANAR